MYSNKKNNKKIFLQKGQAVMVSLIFFIVISLALISGGTLPTGNQIKNSSDFLKSRQSYAALDSVNDDILYMLNHGWDVSSGVSLPFSTGSVTASAVITDLTNKKQIITTGSSTSAVRLSKMILSQNFGTNFSYAAQIGTGGITMTGATITGDVFSNGNVSGDGSSMITGSTTAAYQSTTTVGKIIGTGTNQTSPLKIAGNAWAHEIDNTKNTSGTGYCQVSNYLENSSGSVISCNTSKGFDPSQLAFPITATNITNWKNAVKNQTDNVISAYTYNGDLTIGASGTTSPIEKINGNLTLNCHSRNPANFGNLYVTGNVTMGSQCIFYVDALHVGGTLSLAGGDTIDLSGMSYVEGNITISGGGQIQVDSSLGTNTGYLISDGTMSISGTGALSGSGTTGSYIMMITTSISSTAISVTGGGSAALLVAPYGTVVFSNGSLNGIVAKALNISGGTLTYQSYLGGVVFGGPAYGAWNVLNWNEVSN